MPVAYAIDEHGTLGFVLPEGYDPAWPLVIDPVLSYSTYLGGVNNDEGFGIAVDADVSAYVVGQTYSSNYPTVDPYQGNQNDMDVFVSKLNPSGTALLYSTYLGGSENETGFGIALDSAGRIVVAGESESSDFPTANGYQSVHGGGSCDGQPCDDVFVAQLSSDGSQLLYSTYLGGSQEDDGLAVAVDGSDQIYLTGFSMSGGFPMKNALDASFGGGTCSSLPCPDAIVVKLNPFATGSASLVYSTFSGGNESDKGQAIAVDAAGHAYVVGTTKSSILTLHPLRASRAGGRDAFLQKLNPSASGSASLLYGSYLGGSTDDYGYALALHGANQVFLGGYTRSSNFPTANAYDSSFAGGTCGSRNCYDAFVSHLDLTSNTLAYSTYLGGTGEEQGLGMAVDGGGQLTLTGFTQSSDFPVVAAVQASKGADGCSAPPCADVFVGQFGPDGSQLVFSSYLGGSSTDAGYAVASGEAGSLYLTGSSLSGNFPTTSGGYDVVNAEANTRTDAFVVKLAPAAGEPTETPTVTGTPTATLTLVPTATATATPGPTATQTPPPVEMPSLLWQAGGERAWANFGFSVSGAGDVNGDGYDDVIAGAPHYGNGQTDEGAVYIYYGSSEGLGSTPLIIESNTAGGLFGWSVASAGDINNDGFADLIVGATGCDTVERTGCAYVYLGGANGLSTTPAWAAQGDQRHAGFGYVVGALGDINGDVRSEVFVGAPSYDAGEVDEGKVFVYLSTPDGLSQSAGWTAEGGQANAYFGMAVASAGDVSGDSRKDLLVGAPNASDTLAGEGKAYVFFSENDTLAATAAWVKSGGQEQAHFGEAVSSAGDTNSDGLSDVLVGAPDFDDGETNEGAAFVFLAATTGVSTQAAWIGQGDVADAHYAASVAHAGDIDGNGYPDLLVGAHRLMQTNAGEGRVYLYPIKASGIDHDAVWTVDASTILPDQVYTDMGYAVCAAGDVNGDGSNEFLISAILSDQEHVDEGRILLFSTSD